MAKFQICWKTQHLKFISRAAYSSSTGCHPIVQKAETMGTLKEGLENEGELREISLGGAELQGTFGKAVPSICDMYMFCQVILYYLGSKKGEL